MKYNNKYKYIKNNSILQPLIDEYILTKSEISKIYSFYVTYSMSGNQSLKKRNFTDYGWKSNDIKTIKEKLRELIDFESNNYKFLDKEGYDIKSSFEDLNLMDGKLNHIDTERAVVIKTDNTNMVLNYFHRIRDGFAHGKFILKYSSNNERMVIIQDDNGDNVTGRIVVKLETLLGIISIIDRNNIIG